MVHRLRVDLRAHLTRPHPLNAKYLWAACGDVSAASMMKPCDGRPKCARCEAVRQRAKEAAR